MFECAVLNPTTLVALKPNVHTNASASPGHDGNGGSGHPTLRGGSGHPTLHGGGGHPSPYEDGSDGYDAAIEEFGTSSKTNSCFSELLKHLPTL